MKVYQFIFCLVMLAAQAQGQSTDFPPENPHFANTFWPTIHANNYRQQNTKYAGPTSQDVIRIKTITGLKGGTSCWTHFSEPYPNGQRVILQSNATHFYKILEEKDGFRVIDAFQIDKDWLKSFSWNFLIAKNNVWFTYDPKYNPKKKEFSKIYKLTDAEKGNPMSKIKLLKTYDFGDIGRIQMFALNYNGEIMFYSDNDKGKRDIVVGVLSQDFELLGLLKIKSEAGEIAGHNMFPVDENNSMYFQTTKRLVKVDWKNSKLSIGYQARYDFVGDGPTGRWAEGSGTTPTLLGFGEGNDQLVVMSDGHSQNNLVGFWRTLPKDWKGIAGQDVHFAGKIAIPMARKFSNLFQSIENSPCAYGYDIGIAQFNGFLGQKSPTVKGVQRIGWSPQKRQFEVKWVNDKINMNGVLTYSKGSNMVYGSGLEDDCQYFYYGLDWATGELKLKVLLGKSCKKLANPFDDGGNANVISENGEIYFAGGASIIKLEKVK
jgi:hypothetical protein